MEGVLERPSAVLQAALRVHEGPVGGAPVQSGSPGGKVRGDRFTDHGGGGGGWAGDVTGDARGRVRVDDAGDAARVHPDALPGVHRGRRRGVGGQRRDRKRRDLTARPGGQHAR